MRPLIHCSIATCRLTVLFALLVLSGIAAAQPLPPCDGEPYPAWPDVPGRLSIGIWETPQLPQPWQPADCTGWRTAEFSVLLGAAGRFTAQDGLPGILRRLGQVSTLTGLRYWSVSRNRWTTLIDQAHALSRPDRDARRPDFDVSELQPGIDYYYWQQEPTSSGNAIYGFRLLERSPERLVVSVRNAAPAKRFGLTLLEAGKAETLYVFQRLAGTEWGYYQLTRLGHGRHDWLPVPRASYANRATALFRHIAGLPESALPVWKGDE